MKVKNVLSMLPVVTLIVFSIQSNIATSNQNSIEEEVAPLSLSSDQSLITILATNDMHGGVQPFVDNQKQTYGGLAFWAGGIAAIKEGLNSKYGEQAGVVVVDGGDQFQGTLISNFNEGQLLLSAMNLAGYDAAVPGNHDYDFGPKGWLEDKVTQDTEDKDPRGALRRLVDQAKFSFVSANTYLKNSIVDIDDQPLDVAHVGCKPPNETKIIDWGKAKRPSFVRPYAIKQVAGIKVAMIGIDSEETPKATAIDNINDLCFRDEVQAYVETWKELRDEADVFVLVAHLGNISGSNHASQLTERILKVAGKDALHAVISAHTHQITNTKVRGVPIIQSGSGGKMFGRIDLVFDRKRAAVVPSKLRTYAGVHMFYDHCTQSNKAFCTVEVDNESGEARVAYEGVIVDDNQAISTLIKQARTEVDPLAKRKLGHATGVIKRDRTRESALANELTDVLRKLSNAEIAMLNTGGIRSNLAEGDVTYEEFFNVLPFNNRAVVLHPMPISNLLAILRRSIKTCGSYGAIMQSGLKIRFSRDCKSGEPDRDAQLLRVETLDGELIFDGEKNHIPNSKRTFRVATLDYLAFGTSWEGFSDVPLLEDLGISRELMVEKYLESPVNFSPKVDGRWKEIRDSFY